MSRLSRAAGSTLVLAGALLLIFVVSLQVYSVYTVSQFTEKVALPTPAAPPSLGLPRESPDQAAGVVKTLHRETDPQGGGPVANGEDAAAYSPENATEETPAPVKQPPAARIIIRRINVDSPVVELGIKLENGTWVWEPPARVVGHYGGTANPGEAGNIALTGHISSPIRNEGSVFKRLPELTPGDVIEIVNVDGRVFIYAVGEVRVVIPQDTSVLDPVAGETLTLITCFPDWTYTHRLVVRATRIPMAPVSTSPQGDQASLPQR